MVVNEIYVNAGDIITNDFEIVHELVFVDSRNMFYSLFTAMI